MKVKYLYILSHRYSGSTLLSFLLGSHPDISTIGERRKFYINSIEKGGRNLECSCGKTFQECEHWNKIKANVLSTYGAQNIIHNPSEFQLFKNKIVDQLAYETFLKTKSLGLSPGLLPFHNQIFRQCEFNRVLVDEILKIDRKSAFLDSSKTIKHILFLSEVKQFDVQVIWLSRNPVAQVHSALKYNNWTVEQAAKKWIKEMNLNAKLLSDLNINYIEMSYDQLCEQPENEIKRILRFAGLNQQSVSLDFRAQKQHVMGNYAMRMGSDNKIEIRDEWKNDFSKSQIDLIKRITTK